MTAKNRMLAAGSMIDSRKVAAFAAAWPSAFVCVQGGH